MKLLHRDLLACVTSSLVAVAGCGGKSRAPMLPDAAVPNLAGSWKSACTPMNAQQAFSLDFSIQPTTWAVDYTVYGDLACGAKFMTVRIEGPYEVGAASSVVPGAYEGRFGFTRKAITPHVDAAAQFLASPQGCGEAGFVVGAAKDISQSGCANLGQRPIATCPADYDLVKLDADTLTFGDRPADNDMCSPDKRPKALAKLSSKRS